VQEIKEKLNLMKKSMPIDTTMGRLIRKVDELQDYSLQSKTQLNESQDNIGNEMNDVPMPSSSGSVTMRKKEKASLDSIPDAQVIRKTNKKLL
jgi:hypothetical protein